MPPAATENEQKRKETILSIKRIAARVELGGSKGANRNLHAWMKPAEPPEVLNKGRRKREMNVPFYGLTPHWLALAVPLRGRHYEPLTHIVCHYEYGPIFQNRKEDSQGDIIHRFVDCSFVGAHTGGWLRDPN